MTPRAPAPAPRIRAVTAPRGAFLEHTISSHPRRSSHKPTPRSLGRAAVPKDRGRRDFRHMRERQPRAYPVCSSKMPRIQTLLLAPALLGAACGQRAGSPCDTGSGPSDAVNVASAQAQASMSPSCLAGGPGLSDCGSAKESCCTSLPVTGGTFYRTYTTDGCSASAEADPATVSSFRLDKYDVTVGRFRQFVSAWNGGWTPPPGSGKHTHLNGGQGLANDVQGGFEPGWLAADNSNIVLTAANLTSCMGANLSSDYKLYYYSCNTWTDAPTTQEHLPIVCVNWYEAYAFCIWDGGFLPSEAEWEYAAAAGSEQRQFPWGSVAPGAACP